MSNITRTAEEPLLTLNEVCALGRLTKSGFHHLRRHGRTPPAYRIGRKLWFRPADVEQWLNGRIHPAH